MRQQIRVPRLSALPISDAFRLASAPFDGDSLAKHCEIDPIRLEAFLLGNGTLDSDELTRLASAIGLFVRVSRRPGTLYSRVLDAFRTVAHVVGGTGTIAGLTPAHRELIDAIVAGETLPKIEVEELIDGHDDLPDRLA